MSDFEKALQYVRNHVDFKKVENAWAKMRSDSTLSLEEVDEHLYITIYDWMEEYGEDHNLPEGWWLDEGDVDDIIKML